MNIIKNFDTNVDVDQRIDEEGRGSDAQGASSTVPPAAPNAQIARNVGEQKIANKRAHETIVVHGHKSHPSKAQRMSQSDNHNQSGSVAASRANLPRLQAIVPTAKLISSRVI
jgi:hypothetical protein